MRLLELSLPTPEENLALDEAILEEAECNPETDELLRLWEMPSYSVVLGRSSNAAREIQLANARLDGVGIFRRSSGGASVVTGPGCLLYSVLLSYDLRPELRSLDQAHAYVMGKTREAISSVHPDVTMNGTCDLTKNDQKFSGNALRCKRSFLLYHGTILYDFDLKLISRYLQDPPRKPDYRRDREHGSFVSNLPIDVQVLRERLIQTWCANQNAVPPSSLYVDRLLRERYRNPDWHRVTYP